MGEPQEWLYISKPMFPPWNDGTTVLVRTMLEYSAPNRRIFYLGAPGAPIGDADRKQVVAAKAMGHRPSLIAKLRVLWLLFSLRFRHCSVHFFFTPNSITSLALRIVRFLQPHRVLVQTVMASDGVERLAPLLSPLDRVVVLSLDAVHRLTAAGIDGRRIQQIYPGISTEKGTLLSARTPPSTKQQLIFAGDLDESVVATLVGLANALARDFEGYTLVIAARPKSENDAILRERLRHALTENLACGQVTILGDVSNFGELLSSSRLQVFAAKHTRRKVDIPLVILEGLALGVPVVCWDCAPVNELFAPRDGVGVGPGRMVPVQLGHEGYVRVVTEMIADGEECDRCADIGRNLIRSRFSASTMAEEYETLYQELEKAPPRE